MRANERSAYLYARDAAYPASRVRPATTGYPYLKQSSDVHSLLDILSGGPWLVHGFAAGPAYVSAQTASASQGRQPEIAPK